MDSHGGQVDEVEEIQFRHGGCRASLPLAHVDKLKTAPTPALYTHTIF
jgi:hypothetical protein